MAEIEGMGNNTSGVDGDGVVATNQDQPIDINEGGVAASIIETSGTVPVELTQALQDNSLLPGDFGVSAEDIASAPDGKVFKTESGITLTKNGHNSYTVKS